MSDESPNPSSQGRGALMKKLMDKLKSSPSQKSEDSKSRDSPGSSGRGKIIEFISSGHFTGESTSSGKGRGKLFTTCSEPEITPKELSSTSVSSDRAKDQLLSDSTSLITHTFDEFSVDQYSPSEQIPVIKHGSKGTPINVMTNYIRLKTDSEKGVYQYQVKFEPQVDSRDFRFKYLNQHKDLLGVTRLFDGNELCLPFQLAKQLTLLKSINIVDESDVLIQILFKRKKRFGECIQLYNNLFDRILKILKFVRFGRKQFDPSAPIIIPQHRLEIWPGFVTAVDDYEGGIMLCLDVNHRVLCQMTVLQHLSDIYQNDKSRFQENSIKSLLGSVVITRYNNKLYRIDNIDFEMSPKSTFESNGVLITFAEYYKKQYNITLRDMNQPLLISKKARFIMGKDTKEELTLCLVPEICYLSGLTDAMTSDQRLMRDIATHTRVTPNQRVHSLKIFCENIEKSAEASGVLSAWGLTLEKDPLQLKARQIDNQLVKFRKEEVSVGINADFGQHLNKQVLEAINITNWVLLYNKKDSRFANNFIECMDRNSRPLGMTVSKPQVVVLEDDRTESYVNEIRKNIKVNTQIVVIICPTMRQDRYSAIKKICCSEIPVPSQVINAKTLSNEAKNRSIVQKIALQMNCKLGGTLWSINIPFKKVMIVGIDSYHDPKKRNNSVAAFVSSLNGNYTRWYSRATIQSKKEEFVNGLCMSMNLGLEAFKKINGYLPDKIIVFRDGVGDGELHFCEEYEIPQMKKACCNAGIDYNPTFTFIVVQKRINTRIFAINSFGEKSNPNPGCVLDSEITRKYLYDYFIVSQSVRQGTVSPTHFIVVQDTANFSPDILQQLSYKLCFLYYNWPGSVRVPACCQYAHKMAYLIGQSIGRQTSEKLADKLFYL